MVSGFARSLGSWCMARPARAALVVLALGSVIAGGAMAISPTVGTSLVFQGGVNIVQNNLGPGGTALVYTVPAGRKFMLTDIVIANQSDSLSASLQQVFTGGANCSSVATFRTGHLNIPAGSTFHVPFVTGIGFAAGQLVCIFNGDPTTTTSWTIRGYLFQ